MTKKIKNLKQTKCGQWYKELKKLSNFEKHKREEVQVLSINQFTDQQQAEKIADKMSEVRQEYDPL